MKMGFPIRELMMATNANRPIPDYFENGVWTPRASLSTLANAMDVGNPSNMERVFHLFPDVAALRKVASSISVSDEQIREEIREGEKDWGEIWCPHTATALYARKHQTAAHWVLVATAHPAKFETIVEPLIGHAVPIPPALSEILSRQSSFKEIDPNLNEFLVDDSS
jgi:threonine synthase